MMKRIIGRVLRILAGVLAVLICVGLVVGGFFAIKGYRMYQDAIESTPVEEMVEQIRADEHYVEYDELPQFYIDAVISVEDHRFMSHGGIDVLAIGRALWVNLRTFSLAEGGSTITQQLAKNLYFTQEKKLERKFAEIFVAFDFEREYTKEEIFELYVNTIYFGSGYYGIYDAAMGYFGKTPQALSDWESAMLAGLPNAPSAYSLDSNPELARQRMRQVLVRMVDCEKITESEMEELLSQVQ